MFKVGDKVRLTEDYGGWPVGTTGVVSAVRLWKGPGANRLWKGPDVKQMVQFTVEGRTPPCVCLGFRLELVNGLSSLSDQELADKYRQMHDERLEVFDELLKRGYKVYSKVSGKTLSKLPGYAVKISKTETTDL